jgi:pterin-4a-carbinolamine dehydratase
MSDFDYEDGERDFYYEISGATGEEFEHHPDCNWVYDNCSCGMADVQLKLLDDEKLR